MPFELHDSSEGGDRREDMEDKPTTLLPRGVAGTTVCAEVVETEDEDDEDEDGVGEHERGDGDFWVSSNDDEKVGDENLSDAIA